jgi:hypothetical protein
MFRMKTTDVYTVQLSPHETASSLLDRVRPPESNLFALQILGTNEPLDPRTVFESIPSLCDLLLIGLIIIMVTDE